MVFLLGIKRNLLAKTSLEGCVCPNCNKENTLVASKYGSYFHVFFIPFFPTRKFIDIDCYHCGKKFDGKFIPNDIREAMHRNSYFTAKKRPVWHSCGCFGLLLLTAVVLLFSLGSVIYHYSNPEKAKKRTQYSLAYEGDLKRMTPQPDCQVDSISCQVKTYLDSVVPYAIAKDKVEYFSKVKAPHTKASKVLVLIKIKDIHVMETERESMIVSYVIDALTERGYEKHQLYIGLRDEDDPLIVYTPDHVELDGYGADDTYLENFYKPN